MHNIVISNTTPILSLLKIGKLNLLQQLYGEITIPFAVYKEIEYGKYKPYYEDLSGIDWIKITYIKNPGSRAFLFDLDDSEAEVIILAKELNASIIILDEVMGRRYAKQLDLNLTGTIGILLKAKEKGYLNSISVLLTELIKKGTWLNPKLISEALRLANEK